ncbi:MAG: type II toxin-antitoxin system VapC family toxin [Gammaproteobacteria bacterium]|nr:type II toxin-antitoxin system VapC family toxin [Gammaproteobacteria bacterium]
MSRIFWDTNLFVHLLEDKGELTERVVALRERMVERSDELFTSTLTLGEILVRPVEAGDEELARRYEHAITAAATVLQFDRSAAVAFAGIRRDRSIAPPDAIQLACASVAGVDMFITSDQRLSRKVVPGIHFIQSLANAAL